MGTAKSICLVFLINLLFGAPVCFAQATPSQAQKAPQVRKKVPAKPKPGIFINSPVTPSAPTTKIRRFKTLGFGFSSWTENVTLTGSSGDVIETNTLFYSPTFSYTIRDYSGRFGTLYESVLLLGGADIQNISGAASSYFQKNVRMYAAAFSYGKFYQPEGNEVNFGFLIPVMVRNVNWTEPVGYTANRKTVFTLGLLFDLQWRLSNKIAFNQRLGLMTDYRSALWQMNIEWLL